MFLPLNKKIKKIIIVIFICLFPFSVSSEESSEEPLDIDWSFQGIFGTFDRASLQRGYQVYQEVCAGCHSMEHLSYRNLYEKGGPEFSFEEATPMLAETAFGAPSASLIGQVKIGNLSSVWFNSVLRGDVEQIHIGEETNFQDLSVGHADPGFPLIIGDRVTVGHRCITHGCEIEDDCVIGMGAILMNGVKISS